MKYIWAEAARYWIDGRTRVIRLLAYASSLVYADRFCRSVDRVKGAAIVWSAGYCYCVYRFDPMHEEAARDLSAGPWSIFGQH